MKTLADLPELTFRGFCLFYQGLSARIGMIFIARAWDDANAMPEVVYGQATDQIGPLAWSIFFLVAHSGAFLAILMRQNEAAAWSCLCSALVYLFLGMQASGAPGGLVVEEFSIGLHAGVQALIGYEMLRRRAARSD